MEFKLAPTITVHSAGDEWLALDSSSGSAHILNETAGWLLSIADGFVTLERASKLAGERYSLSAGGNIAREIREAVSAMAAKGIVEIRSDNE